MNEGSSGASSSGFILKKVNGTKLEFLEGYWSSNSNDMSGATMYHTTVEDNGYFDITPYVLYISWVVSIEAITFFKIVMMEKEMRK